MDDLWDDAELAPPPPPRRRRRWRRLLMLILSGLAFWQLPRVTVIPAVRDWPLQQAFSGLAGTLSSGGADWSWFGPIHYRGLLLTTSDGQPLLAIDELTINRNPLNLLVQPTNLGTVAIRGGRLSTAVWQGGSTLETVLEPWLARLAEPPPAAPPAPAVGHWGGAGEPAAAAATTVTGAVELLDCTVELIDLRHEEAWWVTDLAATIPLPSPAANGLLPSDAVMSGRIRQVGPPQLDVVGKADATPLADPVSVASQTAATLARDGGWSLTIAAADTAAARSLAVGGTRLPAGVSRLAASRFGWPVLADGLLDMRADARLSQAPAALQGRAAGTWQLACTGSLAGRQLAVRNAATDREQVVVDRLELPFELTLAADHLQLTRFDLETSLGRASATGRLKLPTDHAQLPAPTAAAAWPWLELVAAEEFQSHAEVDLAAVSRSVAGGIPLRPDVRVTGGTVTVDLTSTAQAVDLRTALAGLTAIQGTSQRHWPETGTAWLRASRLPTGRLQLAEARLASASAELATKQLANGLETTWRCELGDLFAAAAEVFDLRSATRPVALAGTARGRLLLGRSPAAAATTLSAAASLEAFSWSAGGRPIWQDELVAIDLEATGNAGPRAVAVDQASLRIEAGGDLAAAAVVGGCQVSLPTGTGWPTVRGRDGGGGTFDCRLAGDLARWRARAAGLLAIVGGSPAPLSLDLAGQLDSSLTITSAGPRWQITKAKGQIESLALTVRGKSPPWPFSTGATPENTEGFRGSRSPRPAAADYSHSLLTAGGLTVKEPQVVLSAAGSIDPVRGLVELASADILTATASLRTNGLRLATADQPLDAIRGRLQWQADLGRLHRWFQSSRPRYAAKGRVWGTADLLDAGDGVSLLVDLTGSQLALTAAAGPADSVETPQTIWTEPQLKAALELIRSGPAGRASDRLLIKQLSLESSTVGLACTGSLSDLAGAGRFAVQGTVATNFSQLSRLLTPASGGLVQLSGGGPQPFAVSGSLRPAASTMATNDRPVELSLPEQWRQPAAAGTGAGRLIALPRGRQSAAAESLTDFLVGLEAKTTLAWQAGRLAEFPVGPGELPLRLIEGQLAFGPCDIPVSGGRIRGAPWLQLLPSPGELVVPPGPLVEHVVLTPGICSHYLSWLSPILRSATEARGRLSAETGGGRLPLADPLTGRLAGQLWLEDFAVTPGDMAGPLVNLLAQLQSVVDPRFAFGDRVVLLRARPEPIRVRLADGRVHHDNLVLDMGQLSVRSQGSVGRDGSLAMQLEVAFRGDLAGATPVVAGLLRTPLVIPLRGTVRRPQFDATAIDTILGRIMENTADAVLRDGIGRGLEALFGNPQPPRQPQPTPAAPPLTFPESPRR